MNDAASVPEYRRNGLYYPYFHVRDQRWLKVAALYWPKIVRIVPDDYQTLDSGTLGPLIGNFIVSHPPGHSVEAIAPRFVDLVANHADALRTHFRETYKESASRVRNSEWDKINPSDMLTGVHVSEMAPEVREALVSAGLAASGHSIIYEPPFVNSVDGAPIYDHYLKSVPPYSLLYSWILTFPELASVYKSVLVQDFASANKLQPITDQERVYAMTNNWTTNRIASALLDSPSQLGSPDPDDLPEALGFLALELVIPDDLDKVPISRIIDIRDRYGAEFFAFGQAVDAVAASLADLSDIRDQAMLEDYLHQVVTVRFAELLAELRKQMKRLTGDAATMSINVKTQLPAGAALAGGAWLAGHPLLAGTGAAAIGLMAIHRGLRQQRENALQSDPAASFLLHTHAHLQPRNLLDCTIHRLTRVAGIRPSTSAGE